ncbi:MAG: FAD:protein FMN transferase, partial [Colwellia sp.]|nr:FAD:protein FMN transferase [Colwellia sp.]
MKNNRLVSINNHQDGYALNFQAMASPCEVLIQTRNRQLAVRVGDVVANEVWRIEDKYSRYDQLSVCSIINNSAGQAISIDKETYLLLNFAEQCYQLSEGLFDITSGILRKAWHFDGGEKLPSQAQIAACLSYVGWPQVQFNPEQITLAKGMEIDFGGLGKEYAVDRAIILVKELTDLPVLVNLGGDLAVTSARLTNIPWQVAIEHPDAHGAGNSSPTDMIISLSSGALATSGDARRFLLKDGKRYSHVLNAKTGWP